MTTYAYLRKDLVEAGEIPPTSLGYPKEWDWDDTLFKLAHSLEDGAYNEEGMNILLEHRTGVRFYAYSIDFDFIDESELQVGVYEQ